MADTPKYPEKYELATKEEFDDFRARVDAKENWKLGYDSADIKVWEQTVEGSALNFIKMWANIKGIPASLVYDVLHDPDYRKDWDNNMAEGYNIVRLDPYNDIGYYAGKSPFFIVSGRDFCNQRSWCVSPDKTEYLIINHSVLHKSCPEKKGFVRAWSHKTGYLLRVDPEDPNSTILYYLTQTDMRGTIPAWVVNTALKTFAPNLVTNLKKVCPKYNEWKSSPGNPNGKDWLSTEPYHWEKN